MSRAPSRSEAQEFVILQTLGERDIRRTTTTGAVFQAMIETLTAVAEVGVETRREVFTTRMSGETTVRVMFVRRTVPTTVRMRATILLREAFAEVLGRFQNGGEIIGARLFETRLGALTEGVQTVTQMVTEMREDEAPATFFQMPVD